MCARHQHDLGARGVLALSAVATLARSLLAVLLLTTLSACQRKPVTSGECDQLLDKYAELLARVDEPKLSHLQWEQLRAEVHERAAHHRAFKACTREVSREQMDCALGSFSVDEIERCLIPVL